MRPPWTLRAFALALAGLAASQFAFALSTTDPRLGGGFFWTGVIMAVLAFTALVASYTLPRY